MASTSIAFRLTLWYALLSVLLVASAGSVLYWVLADCLRRDDDQWLAGQIAQVSSLAELYSGDTAVLRDKVQRETVMLPGSYLQILDAQGGPLVEASSRHPSTGALAAIPVFGADEGREGLDWRSSKGDMFRLMSAHISAGKGFSVQVAIDRTDEEATLKSYRHILWSVLSASLFLAIVAGYLIAQRSLLPVSRLALIIDDLSAAHLSRRMDIGRWPRELRPLAANFDKLLVRLDESFARISRFSADIAHELRTPLHILRGEAELALSKPRSNDEYRDCIASATEEYDRLSRMVDALLFLARSESPSAVASKASLSLEHEISSVCAFYQALADEQETVLVAHASGELFADAALLRRALGNLLVNALRHTPSGGCIAIHVRSVAGARTEIVVSDNGEGIDAADLPYVFDRFYRADNARAAKGSGTGLGLAIVKSIMQLHDGEVSLESAPGRGTTATLSFPWPERRGLHLQSKH